MIYFNLCILSLSAVLSTVNSQQFSDQALPPVWPNISTACFNALNTTVSDCPGFLGTVSVNNERLSSTQLTSLCTTKCQTGLTNVRQTIINGCTNATDVIRFYDGNVYPATYIADRFIYTYNLACRKDSATGQFCDNIFFSWLNQSTLTAAQNCSDCMLGVQQTQLNSTFGYDVDFASAFQSLTSSCTKTGYPFTSPAKYAISSATATTTATTSASASATPSSICASNYTVQSGDTCNSISLARNVSTYSVIYSGGLNAACTDLLAGSTLCLPAQCTLYTVQGTDTCGSIVSTIGNGVTGTQFLTWNPNINSLCGNLYRLMGNQICISPPGGYLTNVTITTPLAVSTPVSAVPKPTNAPSQSNSRCGKWYTVQDGDTCQSISIALVISLQDFYFLNPEINSNCTNLDLGLAYCVQAVGYISTYSGYPTTSQFITLTSTSYSTSATAAYVTQGVLTTNTSTLFPTASGTVPKCAIYRNYHPPAVPVDQSNSSYVSSFLTSFVNDCNFVAGSYYVQSSDIISWNPSLNSTNGTCNSLQPGFSYCVSMNSTTTEPSAGYGCLPVNSTEIVAGTVKNCTCYTEINGYDNSTIYGCNDLANDYHTSVSQLTSWNPWVGSNCSVGLYANLTSASNRAVCIGVNGTQPTGTPTTSTSSLTSSSSTMGPTQSGIAKNCIQYYTVKQNDSCSAVDTTYNITFAQFYSWNPAVGNNCQYLVIGDAYCVAVSPTSTTSSTTTTSASAAPTRSGTPSTCTTYYTVQNNDSCASIENGYNISFATLYKWNPSIGSNCESLWPGYSLCVAGGP